MARPKKLENMSLAELAKMQANIERVKMDKKNAERAAVREKIMSTAKEHGIDLHELLGRKGGGKGSRGKVAVKYRNNAGRWRYQQVRARGGVAGGEDRQ